MIDITGVNLIEFVKKVYELSVPVGMGFMHAEPGGLTSEEAAVYIDVDNRIVVSMDYVKGRQCKMTVFEEDDKFVIRDQWFDHSDSALEQLLKSVGVER